MGIPATFGSVLERTRLGGAVLTEAAYDPGFRIAAHAHDHASLMWVASGQVVEEVGPRGYRCGLTDLMWKQAGLDHSNVVGGEPSRVFVLELLPAILDDLSGAGTRIPDAPAHVSGAPAALFTRLCSLLAEGGTGAGLGAQDLVLGVLAAVGVRSGRSESGTPLWLQTVRDRLHDECTSRLSLGELARDAGVHPVYLARAFRKRFGCSVTEYLHARRIDLAVGALASGEEEIGRLALRLGYYDHAHFSRVFARAIGIPPSRYRRLARDGA